MSAPVCASPLALLGQELTARIGTAHAAAARIAREIGYCVRTAQRVMRGEDRPSELLVELLALELCAGPEVAARWQALRVASIAPPEPEPVELDPRPVAPGVSPLRAHRARRRVLAYCAWCSRALTSITGEGRGREASCRDGYGCAVAQAGRAA